MPGPVPTGSIITVSSLGGRLSLDIPSEFPPLTWWGRLVYRMSEAPVMRQLVGLQAGITEWHQSHRERHGAKRFSRGFSYTLGVFTLAMSFGLIGAWNTPRRPQFVVALLLIWAIFALVWLWPRWDRTQIEVSSTEFNMTRVFFGSRGTVTRGPTRTLLPLQVERAHTELDKAVGIKTRNSVYVKPAVTRLLIARGLTPEEIDWLEATIAEVVESEASAVA